MSKFSKCNCQFCNKGIEFESSDFSEGEVRAAICPHCGIETSIFIAISEEEIPPKERIHLSGLRTWIKIILKIKAIKDLISDNFERVVFKLVRIFALLWSGLIFIGFLSCTINYALTFMPSKNEGSDTSSTPSLLSLISNQNIQNLGVYLCALFILFCILTLISFVLLLLAIERNTRNEKVKI